VTSSVDGLISGLSTSALISQMMQLEAAPQNRLKSKVTNQQTVISAYQSINSKLAALETAAAAMGTGSLTATNNWQAAKATTSSTSVTASAAAGARPGSLTVDVTKLARAQVSTTAVPATGDATTADTLELSVGGAPVSVDISADRSAKGIADAINKTDIGVRASLVTTSTGTVLQLSATKTGAAHGFDVTAGLTAPLKTAIAASDAELLVGDQAPGAGGYKITSDTNTFANVLPGVSVTVSKLETGVQVDVAADSASVAAKVKAMVDAANSVLAELAKQSSTSTDSKGKVTSATLAGDNLVRNLSSKVISQASAGLAGYGSFKQVGVEITRDGKITFDQDAFLAAYAADPAKAKLAASSLADTLKGTADAAQKSVTTVVQSHNNMISTLNDQIANWDVRLATRQNTLQRQFSSLEVALGNMKNQSSWLAGQISSLPSGS
jgi:flagellar hook-associated protein 2